LSLVLALPFSDFGECRNNPILTVLAHKLTLKIHAAGVPRIFNETCSGICYNDFVIGPPSNYDNAYFEVRSVRVFGPSTAVEAPQGSNAPQGHAPQGRNGASQKDIIELGALVTTLLVLLMAL
jgi:hypothetical protein